MGWRVLDPVPQLPEADCSASSYQVLDQGSQLIDVPAVATGIELRSVVERIMSEATLWMGALGAMAVVLCTWSTTRSIILQACRREGGDIEKEDWR